MQARMKNPVEIFPEASRAITDLKAIVAQSGLAAATRNLVQLRASQVNESCPCILAASRQALEEGESDIRVLGVAGWRLSPHYNDAERAALALAEVITRMEGDPPVPDDVWDAAGKHFDERGMAALLLTIAIANGCNRFSISTRQVAGT
jgi:AhpD family alkylhydroperoxidase